MKVDNRDNDVPVVFGCFSGQLEEKPREVDSKDNGIPFGSGYPSENLYEN